MRKVIFLPIISGLLSVAFLTSCDGKQHVTISEMVDDVIAYEEMISILDKHDLEIPPIYKTTPGAEIRMVVIEFDINRLPLGETYDDVRVTATLYERGPNSLYYTENAKFITGVPQNIRQEASVEEVRRVAGNFTAAASDLTKKITSVESSFEITEEEKENYIKLYQTTAFNKRPPASLVWTFTPFKGEEILAGVYYAFAFVDVRDPNREFRIQADTSCIYKAPILFGLYKMKLDCVSYNGEWDLLPDNHLAPVLPEETLPPLPAEEIVLVFGGWQEFREAVLNAVDWSSLMRDRNVRFTFQDLEGGQVDVSSRERDIGLCQQWLAEAGYPDGYSNFPVIILPGSEALTQTAEALGVYLADCGIRADIVRVDSASDAYQKLMVLSAAGEAGLSLSIRGEE